MKLKTVIVCRKSNKKLSSSILCTTSRGKPGQKARTRKPGQDRQSTKGRMGYLQ
jgi:hypothetical protein